MTRIFNSKVECLNEVERLKLLQKRNPLRPEMIPPELANSSQWIVWSYEVYERKNGKFGPNKTPYKTRNPRLQPSRWGISDCSDLVTALQCVKDNSHIDGIGYLFLKDDGLIGVDFDDCRNPQTGKVRKEYQFWIDRLGGYAEVSPSGTGIKIWVKGTVDNRCFKTDKSTGFRIQNFADGIIEVYRRGQYFTVTTQCLKGFEHIKPAQEELDVLSEFYLSYTRNALSGSWVSGEHGPNVINKVIEQNFWGEINSGDIDESDIQFKPAIQTVITGSPTTPKPQLVLQGPHILEERASLCQCTGCINCSLSSLTVSMYGVPHCVNVRGVLTVHYRDMRTNAIDPVRSRILNRVLRVFHIHQLNYMNCALNAIRKVLITKRESKKLLRNISPHWVFKDFPQKHNMSFSLVHVMVNLTLC